MKAVRSLEIGLHWLRLKNADELTEADIDKGLAKATDERLFVVAEALRRGYSVERIAELSARSIRGSSTRSRTSSRWKTSFGSARLNCGR